MSDFGRILMFIGLSIFIVGVIITVSVRLFPMLGNLPGDFSYESSNSKVYVPFMTMLVISILGTILLNIILRFFK